MEQVILNNVRLDPDGDYADMHHRTGTASISLGEAWGILGPAHLDDPSPEGVDGAGKVHALWFIHTPRGSATLYDYWWNGENVLSIGAGGRRSTLWAVKWLRLRGIPCKLGLGDRSDRII